MKRVYLTINESGRHIQYADINEDNYVCNVETSDEDAMFMVDCINRQVRKDNEKLQQIFCSKCGCSLGFLDAEFSNIVLQLVCKDCHKEI